MRNLLDLLLFKIISFFASQTPKCESCKHAMNKRPNPKLFLLPLLHDAEYTPSKEYYLRNCYPINDISEIPTGYRACRFWELRCPNCAKAKVLAEDFLLVRREELIEMRNTYELDHDFVEFLR